MLLLLLIAQHIIESYVTSLQYQRKLGQGPKKSKYLIKFSNFF